MKFYANKLTLCSAAAFGLAVVATFTACGDSNTTEVTEQTGMDILAKGEKLPDCTKDNAGDMLYVTDSAAVYYCADGKWATLNGKDGEPGKEGTSSKGKPGTSCSAKTVDNGIEVSCDGKVIGTIKNGEPGKSATGKNGGDCKIDESEGDGIVKVTCGENGTPVTLYKAMCGTESYEPAEKLCSEGKLYSCDGKPFDPAKEYCLTLKDKNGQSVSKVEALLIDDHGNGNVQVYKTVTIGTQVWMAENLNYNTNTESETNSWCGGGEEKNEGDCSVYGRHYTWDAAKSACPTGWHLPSDVEWETLFKVVDAEYTLTSNIVGQKLKANSSLWKTYIGGTNDDTFGFSVLPAGYSYTGNFSDEGNETYFWSAIESDSDDANSWHFDYYYGNVDRYSSNKEFGYSVRCLKGETSASSASN